MTSERFRTQVRLIVLLASVFLCIPAFVAAQSEAPALTTDEIVARMAASDAQRSAKQKGYRGIRHYTLDYKGFPGDKHAEMVVQVISKPPNKELTIVSESGSKFLLNRVLHKLVETEQEASEGNNRKDVKLTADNYGFQLIGTDTVQGRPCYVLQVDPKRKNKFLYKGKIWVDAADFTLTQISAKPAQNPSFWISSVQIEHQYEKHGDMWLPRRNESTSKVRLGGHAVLTIDYQQYKILERSAASIGQESPMLNAYLPEF